MVAPWVIPAAMSAIGTGFAIKGASDSQNANNKAVKAQNQYDKKVYKYNIKETENRFVFNQNETNIARDNNEQQLAYREQIDLDNYEAAMKQRQEDYKAQSRAYKQSNKDYKDYKDLNNRIGEQARTETLNKFKEQKLGLQYNNQRSRLSELETMQGLSNQMRGAENNREDATADLNLANKRNNRAYTQQIDQLDISDRKLNNRITSTTKEKEFQENLYGDKLDSLKIGKNKELDSIKNQRDRQELIKNQTISQAKDAYGDASLVKDQATAAANLRFGDAKLVKQQAVAAAQDAYGDAKLLKEQNVDSIKAKFERANQSLDQENRSLDLSFAEQQSVNTQQKDELDAEYKAQELQSAFSNERADLKFDSAKDENFIQNSAIRDTLGDQTLVANQNLDALTDEEKYQLFEVEGNLEALQGSLDSDGNRLGGDLNALKLRYESESAARAFEAEAKMFEGLSAEGSVAARGQRGKSAARNLSSIMASIGRQQAQTADSILRGAKVYGSQKKSIEDKITRANNLKSMYGVTTSRKKMDINETYQRQTFDKNRLIGDQSTRLDNLLNERGLTKDQNRRDLLNKDENRLRRDTDITERESYQRARRDLEQEFNKEDLTLNEADEIREIGDQQENLARAKLDKERSIKNAKDNLERQRLEKDRLVGNAKDNLERQKLDKERSIKDAKDENKIDETFFSDAEEYARSEYRNSLSQLTQNQRSMVNSLNSQLKQYGIDITGNTKQRKASLQDFKTTQTAAQNAFDSSERDFALTSYEIDQKRINAESNKLIRQSEYADSVISAMNAKNAAMQGIRLDEYSANLTADKARMVKPQKSPKPPAPIKYPRTIYQDPRKPGTPPPPVKGAMQSGAVFQAIGSGLGRLAQMDFSGPNLK